MLERLPVICPRRRSGISNSWSLWIKQLGSAISKTHWSFFCLGELNNLQPNSRRSTWHEQHFWCISKCSTSFHLMQMFWQYSGNKLNYKKVHSVRQKTQYSEVLEMDGWDFPLFGSDSRFYQTIASCRSQSFAEFCVPLSFQTKSLSPAINKIATFKSFWQLLSLVWMLKTNLNLSCFNITLRMCYCYKLI